MTHRLQGKNTEQDINLTRKKLLPIYHSVILSLCQTGEGPKTIKLFLGQKPGRSDTLFLEMIMYLDMNACA